MNSKILIILIIVVVFGVGGFFVYQNVSEPSVSQQEYPSGTQLATEDEPVEEPPTAEEGKPTEIEEIGEVKEKPKQTIAQEFNFPSLNTNTPLPELPAKAPQGEWVIKNLGNVEISYFSTAIIWGMTESGTDVLITLKNKGSSQAVVNFTPVKDLLSQVPSWNYHFFGLQDPPLKLGPGEEKNT